MKPFAKTFLVGFAKWYLEVHRRLWWKRKYLPLKSGKKRSERLLCFPLIDHTVLHLSPQEAFLKDCSCRIWKVIFWSKKRDVVKRELSSVTNLRVAFRESAVCYVNTSHRVIVWPSRSLSLRLFLWDLQSYLWKPLEGYGENWNIFS